MKQPINSNIKIFPLMPKGRTPKDRTAEIQAVYDGLKFCSIADLRQIKVKADNFIKSKKEEELQALKKQRDEIDAEIEKLEKED